MNEMNELQILLSVAIDEELRSVLLSMLSRIENLEETALTSEALTTIEELTTIYPSKGAN